MRRYKKTETVASLAQAIWCKFCTQGQHNLVLQCIAMVSVPSVAPKAFPSAAPTQHGGYEEPPPSPQALPSTSAGSGGPSGPPNSLQATEKHVFCDELWENECDEYHIYGKRSRQWIKQIRTVSLRTDRDHADRLLCLARLDNGQEHS